MPHETNEQFIKRIMTQGCPTGALVQGFVIQALMDYSAKVIVSGPAKFESTMLNGDAWVKTAKFVRDELNKTYGGG